MSYFPKCRAAPSLSTAVSQVFSTNAIVPVPVTVPLPGTPLIFSSVTGAAYTNDQMLFQVSCASTVTLFFSGTLGYYSTGHGSKPAYQQLCISLINTAAPSMELNPNPYINGEFIYCPDFLVLDSLSASYVFPEPISLSASFALLPGTYAARVNTILTDVSFLLPTFSFVAFLGGSMTARIVKAHA